MATETEIQSQIGKAIILFEELRKFGHVNVPSYIGSEDDLIQSLETAYADDVLRAVATVRGQLASAISEQSVADVLTPLLISYAKVIDVPERDPQAILTRVFDNMINNSLALTSRQFVFGTPSAGGSNVGNGVLNRLTTDAENQDIENQYADSKTAKCIADEHSGAEEHEEVFEIRGGAAERDDLERIGSGSIASITALSARQVQRYVRNPSFERYDGTLAVPTSIDGWTALSDISNFALSETAAEVYRGYVGVGTARSLEIKANDTLEQNLNVTRARFNPFVPVYLQVAWNREEGLGDGTLTLHLGSQSTSVVLAAQTGWQILRLAIGQKNWFKVWNEEDPKVKIQLSGRTTGSVFVDDVILHPYQLFDGAWYALVGGATPFLRDDLFTFSDTETGSILQRWFWRGFRRYLPHATGGSVTWAEPTGTSPTPTPTPSPTPTPTP